MDERAHVTRALATLAHNVVSNLKKKRIALSPLPMGTLWVRPLFRSLPDASHLCAMIGLVNKCRT